MSDVIIFHTSKDKSWHINIYEKFLLFLFITLSLWNFNDKCVKQPHDVGLGLTENNFNIQNFVSTILNFELKAT